MYYAVVGNNGFGVYDNYYKMLKNKEFLTQSIFKKFNCFYEAFGWARDIYNDGQAVDDAFYGASTDIRINWIIYRNDIRKKNTEE